MIIYPRRMISNRGVVCPIAIFNKKEKQASKYLPVEDDKFYGDFMYGG